MPTAKLKSANLGFSIDESGSITFNEEWSITVSPAEVSSVSDIDYLLLYSATGLPQVGQRYGQTNARVSGMAFAVQESNPYIWTATVTFSPDQVNLPQTDFTDVEKSRLISLSSTSKAYTETIDSAYFVATISKSQSPAKPNFKGKSETDNNEPIDNTAGDKIIGITDNRYNVVVYLTQREEDGFNPELAYELQNYVNYEPLRIAGFYFDAQEGMITSMRYELKNPTASTTGYPTGKYYVGIYEIERRIGGWYQKVVNDGFRQIKDGKKADILNSDIGSTVNPTDKVSDPVKLDETGAAITNDDVFYRVAWPKFAKKWSSVINFVSEGV